MQAHDGVDAGMQQQGDVRVRAEPAIGQDDIVRSEEGEEQAKEFTFMDVFGTLGPV